MLPHLPTAVLSLLSLFLIPSTSATTSNATHHPLFSSHPSSLQTLHTSLATLLPILPLLAPPPSHTLVLTTATPAFKPLLYNWMCFLRHKALWGSSSSPRPYDDVPKFLVVTSDEAFAEELAELGVVVWLLKVTPWDDVKEEDEEDDDWMAKELGEEDLFLNLRIMELLLPPTEKGKDLRKDMIGWGSLQYQSLMLERSLAVSALVGALVESQRVEIEDRKEEERKEVARIVAHDWESGPMEKEEWVGVRGVLVVDNDAVWLSSPNPFLTHPYRPLGPHPSLIFAPDMAPTSSNAWGTYSMPCACFIYTRTSDHTSHLTSSHSSPDTYRPASLGALAWRNIALCHISMLLSSLRTGRAQAARIDPSAPDSIQHLFRAKAPSFQATALGPAIYLAEQAIQLLPSTSHAEWMQALGSGQIEDLEVLLENAGLGEEGTTCLDLAKANHDVCTNHSLSPDETSLSSPEGHWESLRSLPLPYDVFPPGNSFFGKTREEGVRPCVVHANYATGKLKEDLLKRERLWALGGDAERGWTCDAEVMRNA